MIGCEILRGLEIECLYPSSVPRFPPVLCLISLVALSLMVIRLVNSCHFVGLDPEVGVQVLVVFRSFSVVSTG